MIKVLLKFLLFFILSYFSFFGFSKASKEPAGLPYVEKSVWRYHYINERKVHRGTGFFIGENLFVTNLHVLLGSSFLEDILKEEKAIQNITLSQKGNSSVLRVKRILRISAVHDLALLEIEGAVSNYLSLEGKPLRPKEDLFVLGYPGGVFKRMRSTGYSFYEEDYFYSFPVNYSTFSGASGGPVLNEQGHVVGVIFRSNIHNILRAIKLNYLKAFVKGESGLNCLPGFAGAGYCIQAEVENLKNQAAKGQASAQHNLAVMYNKELGMEQNPERAVYWWKRAAEQGYASAQYNLAPMYYKGEGAEQNPEQAFHWWKKAAEQGHASAQHSLAGMYYNGEGVEQNPEQAVYWLEKAAEQGHASVQYNLARIYYKGEGVEQNPERAVYWWKRAAEQGHASAQHNLASIYYNGEGAERDPERAFHWWKKAAEQGHASAQYNLGLMYYNGEGTERNPERAVYWLEKAAEQGHTSAQHILGW